MPFHHDMCFCLAIYQSGSGRNGVSGSILASVEPPEHLILLEMTERTYYPNLPRYELLLDHLSKPEVAKMAFLMLFWRLWRPQDVCFDFK